MIDSITVLYSQLDNYEAITIRQSCVQNPGTPIVPAGPEFDNCEVLDDTFQLSWRVDNNNSQVRFQLCGCTARCIDQYNNAQLANFQCKFDLKFD